MYVMYGGCWGPDVADLILLRPKHSSRFILILYYVCTCVRHIFIHELVCYILLLIYICSLYAI